MKNKRKKVFAERRLFANQQPANQSTAELQLKVEPKAEKGSQGAEPCPSICFRMLMIVAFPLSLVVFGLGFLLLIPRRHDRRDARRSHRVVGGHHALR